MSGKVKLGIIGLGAQGTMYAKFIADGMVPNMVIGAIADTHEEKRNAAAQEYGGGTFRYMEAITLAGLLFLLVSYPTSLLVRRMENRLA